MINYFTIFDTESEKYVNLHEIIHNHLEIRDHYAVYDGTDIEDHIIFTEEPDYVYNGRGDLIQDTDRWFRWRVREVVKNVPRNSNAVYSLKDTAEELLNGFVCVRIIKDVCNDLLVPNFLDSEPLLELYLIYKELTAAESGGMWDI